LLNSLYQEVGVWRKNKNVCLFIYFTCLIGCSFDSGLCSGWNQSVSDDFDWTLSSGSTPSASTGPSAGQGGSGLIQLNCFLLVPKRGEDLHFYENSINLQCIDISLEEI